MLCCKYEIAVGWPTEYLNKLLDNLADKDCRFIFKIGETIDDLSAVECKKAARVKKTLKVSGQLPASYCTHSRREAELLADADAFADLHKVSIQISMFGSVFLKIY